MTALAAMLTLTACSKTGDSSENSDFIPDPFPGSSYWETVVEYSSDISDSVNASDNFSETSSNDLDQVRDTVNQLSAGGCSVDINGGKPLVYDGDHVKLEITFAPSERNALNCSEGIMVFINELPQEVSADGVNYSYMAVYSELEPGKEYTKELYFKPAVLRGDKEDINVYFADCFNPDYRPQESYLTFGNTHSFAGFAARLEMTMNTEIEQIVEADIENDIREEIAANVARGANGIVKKNNGKSNGYFLNEDGTLSGTYVLTGEDHNSTHRIAFFVNDNPVTFNGGKRFCDIEYKSGFKYSFDFTLDENPGHMDYFYAMDISENDGSAHMHAYVPEIIVRNDYEFKP